MTTEALGAEALAKAALALIARELDRAETPCVTSSFQAECVVLVHLLRQSRRDIPVLFLDTVHHFEETIRYRDAIAAAWDLNLVTVRAAEPAVGLWRESTQACCGRHKVDPLFGALRPYDTWFTGLRREQSASRAGLQEIEPFTIGGGRTRSRCCRCTTAATRASGANPARRCRWIRQTRARAGGVDRSWSAASIFSPSSPARQAARRKPRHRRLLNHRP